MTFKFAIFGSFPDIPELNLSLSSWVMEGRMWRCKTVRVLQSYCSCYLFIYLFNTLLQEGDAISYKLFFLAALIITTTTICTIYTKSHSYEFSNKTRNSQYTHDNYKFVVRFDFICLTSRFLNEDIVLADLTAVGNLFQIWTPENWKVLLNISRFGLGRRMLEFDADLRLYSYTFEFWNVNNSETYDGHRPCTDLKSNTPLLYSIRS